MLDFTSFYQRLEHSRLAKFRDFFETQINANFNCKRHGDLDTLLGSLKQLPVIDDAVLNCKDQVSLSSQSIRPEQQAAIDAALKQLIPWRKGPFQVFATHIDTEWRSDWKWQRVLPHLSPLAGRKVLDVGCGSGYHCWRMLGEQAQWVLGVEPSARFMLQFALIKHFAPDSAIDLVPLTLEQMPAPLDFFDTVFSMGVLYHRSSPMDHLKELRACLRPGGELVLETLVVDGELGYSLVPDDRYAQMRNVWFLPSVPTLIQWLGKCGFEAARCVDLNQTSLDEQRSTEWMPSHSLRDFLDADNPALTVEGLPAPKRAVIIAKRPEAKRHNRA
ncbi:tRNA 5-methoxyuridine(34)/uridine 5-oxyacetic acid(34) synthase CmoB [Agaribacterium haliotis]|uniref:tRNA 5-methoxyuridine(34)/uridine 5-oxyacetic acid(34) synthase CmoB n=1 Tax=Agaribacterium haliotis TaxID=2013869 RepID=UPI000BB5610B|nr:tRNA 5-methoxyuridine(34)/uridine 5-oxyacetic acid(34) synthase CmoB [Agaribacterium haliotis]